MPQTNPYESPKAEFSKATVPVVASSAVKTLRESLQLLGMGTLFGVLLAMLACAVLSGGSADWWFYPIFGISGAAAGLFGAAFGGVIIAIMRRATRKSNRPTVDE
jgi:ABC-type uncharacterized transport system permease subunit